MTPEPCIPDVGVLSLVPDTWGGPWMTRHQMLTRLAKYFHVVWVEPAKEWNEPWLRGPEQRSDLVNPAEADLPGLSIYRSGRLLPRLHRPKRLAEWVVRMRLKRARSMLPAAARGKTILHLWRFEFDDYLNCLRSDLSCYHIDDDYTFSDVEQPIDPREAHVLEQVDQVILTSPGLAAHKGKINKNTILVPNGVDFEAFSSPREEPEDLKAIARPRVGYVGVIKRQLDFSLMLELAQRNGDVSFVLVGPRRDTGESTLLADRLAALPNVHFLGGKSVEDLPAYVQHFDVCKMCYVVNDYTNCIYPLKLHEYLATGRPVIATPIRTLLDFRHVITLAKDADEWSTAIRDAVRPEHNTDEHITRRRAIAREHDRDRLAACIAYALGRRLGPSYAERIETSAAEDLEMTAEELRRNPVGVA